MTVVSAFTVSCSLVSGPPDPNAKLRLTNVKLNQQVETMVIITGEAWNDDAVPVSGTITGTLMDSNGKVIVTGDQSLPVIQPGMGVPFNIPFTPNGKVAKHSVVVKTIDKPDTP
jgi:hypothetical protein